MKKQRIAIIGGGISGLAVAYNLLENASASNGKHQFEIDIYEATGVLGGNADSAEVDLGVKKYSTSNEVAPEHLKRMADLGVDDFNLTTYTRIAAIMDKIGFKKFKDYRPLEDTACFFKLDGSKVLTADGELHHGTSDSKTTTVNYLDPISITFMKKAYDDLKDNFEKYKLYEVGRYVSEYISEHLKKIKDKTDEEKQAEKKLLEDMRDFLLYPRINAMYFTDDVTGPAGMPLRAVMQYYKIQEGIGQKGKPDRNYFVRGSQSWIDALKDYLTDKNRVKGIVKIRKNFLACVHVDGSDVWISKLTKPGLLGLPQPERYDKVVMACHADDAMRAIQKGLSQDLINVLDKVTYTNSIAVAHTFAGVLAPDRNAWRTYNVLIREGQAIHPYSMTYVMNRHQNDAAEDSEYNKAGMPQYFVTLNPCVPIPDEYVLRTPKDVPRKPAGYFKQFEEGEKVLPGWRQLSGNLNEGQPDLKGELKQGDRVIGWFKHNVLNFACLEAQEELKELQGGDFNNLYFVGGWTNGAGLHEECWDKGEQIANLIIAGKHLKSQPKNSKQTEKTVGLV